MERDPDGTVVVRIWPLWCLLIGAAIAAGLYFKLDVDGTPALIMGLAVAIVAGIWWPRGR